MFSRRQFCECAAWCCAGIPSLLLVPRKERKGPPIDVAVLDRHRVLRAADEYMGQAPITITAFTAARSAGGPHDYFSEGDYWWPDPKNPGGPYIQRDGQSNPDNFTKHRHALLGLSVQMPALAAAWLLTQKEPYAQHAVRHLRAWFVDEATRMNPNLEYAQAIHGRTTGRGTGIIDTLHLVEVVRAASVLEKSPSFSQDAQQGVKDWFAQYVQWMTASHNGIDERNAQNNHGTCWVLQVAEFASYTGNTELLSFCRDRFTRVLIPNQIAPNGSFPRELARTKPYGYSLFNLDVMTTACRVLSTPQHNLWNFALPDGRGVRKAVEYMFPYIANKKTWPLPPDVQYFDQWPVRQPSLLFAGLAYSHPDYLELWRKLNPDPTVEEAVRNFPIRQPVLWMSRT